tara:strand:- start:434 stop:796 length:363 start_codon:yes stop_codon:yes gene_type:complete
MKQTWKTFTLTVKRQAIRDMKALVAQGNSVSRARKLVADQKHLRVTPNTIYNWERALTGKSTQTKGLRVAPTTEVQSIPLTNNIVKTRITGVNLHVPGKGSITLDHDTLQHIAQLAGHIG